MNKIYVLQKHADIDRKVLLHRIFLHAPETVSKTKERKTVGKKINNNCNSDKRNDRIIEREYDDEWYFKYPLQFIK